MKVRSNFLLLIDHLPVGLGRHFFAHGGNSNNCTKFVCGVFVNLFFIVLILFANNQSRPILEGCEPRSDSSFSNLFNWTHHLYLPLIK